MKITNELALKNIGRYADMHRRMVGNYPYKFIRFADGRAGLKTPDGTCMPIEDTGFNAKTCDYIFEMVEFCEEK